MRVAFETERLVACYPSLDCIALLLAYEKRNQQAFKPFSAPRQTSYYTLASIEDVIERQISLMESRRMIGLYFFHKQDPLHILGVAQVNHIVWGCNMSGKLGYSIDHQKWNQGYGTEAVQAAVDYAFKQFGLHRLEADIMAANTASVKLVQHLGFANEGICRKYAYIEGRWVDHLRFSLVNDRVTP